MSKTSPKQRLITFKSWLSTVKPVKIKTNKGKKKRNEKNNSKYRTTSRS